jgi:hypothetical protein
MCIHDIFRDDIGFIISKEGKLLNPKKIQVIVNMPPPKNPQQFRYSIGWHSFTNVLSKHLLLLWHLSLN